MFNQNDIVMIHTSEPERCMPNSPALVLDGTIARIKSKDYGKTGNASDVTYKLQFLEMKVREDCNEELMWCENCAWRDEHLVPFPAPEEEELDTSELFME